MYDEKEDFHLHQQECNTIFDIFNYYNIQVDPNMIVLDLCAGLGMHGGILSSKFKKIYCSDIINYSTLYDGEFIKLLNEKHKRNNIEIAINKMAFIENDAMDMIYKDQFFDMSICINGFEHIPDPRRALFELGRVTKNGGYIYITFDPIWTADSGSHFYHRVNEPWAHLALSRDQYIARMLANGSNEHEVDEFKNALNRWRLWQFKTIFHEITQFFDLETIDFSTWSGVVDDRHYNHPNLDYLLSNGYSREELLLRGIRCVMRKHG